MSERARRRAHVWGWASFAGLLALSLTLRFAIVPWSHPARLTLSHSPLTDEAWQAMTAQNQARDPNYTPKPLTQRMDRVRALWPIIHATNYVTARSLGLGVMPRRYVAYGLYSLIVAGLAWWLSRGRDPLRASLFVLLAAGSLPLAFHYRVGLGYDVVVLQMALVVMLLRSEQAGEDTRPLLSIPRLSRLLVAGLLCGVTVATFLNALPFGAACAIWLLLPDQRGFTWPSRVTWLRWLSFGAAAVLALGLVFTLWTYPNGGFDPELFRERTPSIKRLWSSVSNLRLFPMRLHEPFLLALFAYLGLTQLFSHGFARTLRTLLILWATLWIAYLALIPYQPVRYLQFCLIPMALLVADAFGERPATAEPRVWALAKTWLAALAACVPLLLASLPKYSNGREALFAAWSLAENLALLRWLWWALPCALIAVTLIATYWGRVVAHRATLAFLLAGFVLCNGAQFYAWQRNHHLDVQRAEPQVAHLLNGRGPTLVDLSTMPYVQSTTSTIYVFDERYVAQYKALGIRTYITSAKGDWRMLRYLQSLGLGPGDAFARVRVPAMGLTLDIISSK